MKKKKADKSSSPDKSMTVAGHLRELRNRVLVCVVVLIVVFVAGIQFAPKIVDILTSIGRQYNYEFVYISPQELLMQYFSVALVMALCVTFPLILYQAYAYISPGLRKHENLFFRLAMVCGLICFVVGVTFAFKIMLPFMLYFLIHIGAGSDITASISVQNYITFLMTVFVCFGVIFELPVVSVLLTQLGILKVSWMKKARKVMIVVIFIIAAFITPPDVISQVMVAVPILFLYEFSIILCTVLKPREGRKKE